MREFFHGWRRKTGIVLLVMACALAVLWIRTSVVADVFQLSHLAFGSIRGGIYWCWHPAIIWDWSTIPEEEIRSQYGSQSLTEVLSGEFKTNEKYGYVFYWCLVLPLTLLSAYLILWKPRNPT